MIKYPIVKSEVDRTWMKYCGFLDLSLKQFAMIQESLLMQQINKISESRLGQKIMGTKTPRNLVEFRNLVPLTRYEDYLPELENKDETCLADKPVDWAHTSGGSVGFRKAPVTEEALQKQLDHLMAAFILSCAKGRGISSIAEGDRVLFNVAPKPYLSGLLTEGAANNFNFSPIYPPHDHDNMDFKEKMSKGFESSLKTGMDILVAMTSVLVKTGEEFEKRSHSSGFLKHFTHPGEAYRVSRAFLQSKMEKRKMLPKDLWNLKSLICWGIDTEAYAEQVYKYWGVRPYQFHACTEAGLMAVQSWTRKGMTFIPNSNFYEFIPENEWLRSREDMFYQPETVLLSEVKPGETYELVITNFHGGPFIRYRLGHLVRFTDIEDREARIDLPQMIFEARSDDLIDIAGFTRVCEKSISQALASANVKHEDWVARKEMINGKPALHIFLELRGADTRKNLDELLHEELVKVDQGYHDLAGMMEIHPLQVTLLNPGSFKIYARYKQEAGYELAQQRPIKMNAIDEDIDILRGLKIRSKIQVART